MGLIKALETSFEFKKFKGWDTIYYAFDIHSTIIRPNYQRGNIPTDFYPMAKEALQLISAREDIVMMLYTCSHPNEIEQYLKFFSENGINFKFVNENLDVPTDLNGYGNYDKKPYFNVLFEDKAGFDAEIEWQEIYAYFKNKVENEIVG